MERDLSPDAGRSHRKRKVGDEELLSGPSKPSKAIHQQDSITILRAAIEFRERTGAPPTQLHLAELYKSVEGKLQAEMSAKQVWNRLRTLRTSLKTAVVGDDHVADPVHKLSAELWSGSKDDKEKNAMVEDDDEDTDDEEEEEEEEDVDQELLPSQLQAYPYLARAAEDNWKKQGLPNGELLQGLKVNPVKTMALEDKWRKHMMETMNFQLKSAKVHREILEEVRSLL